MQVHDFSKNAGVEPDVVRFYVRVGLLEPARNPANGYKVFGTPHLVRLKFIRHVQALGFTLAEIRGFLSRLDGGEAVCEEIRQALDAKIAESQECIRRLVERQHRIEAVRDAWDRDSPASLNLGQLCRALEQAWEMRHGPPRATMPLRRRASGRLSGAARL
jgi:DNA-binding transcriptional MerR regulator